MKSIMNETVSLLFKKQCYCKGSSSGPRVASKTYHKGNAIYTEFTIARIVCDVCDTPWITDIDIGEISYLIPDA